MKALGECLARLCLFYMYAVRADPAGSRGRIQQQPPPPPAARTACATLAVGEGMTTPATNTRPTPTRVLQGPEGLEFVVVLEQLGPTGITFALRANDPSRR
eukprot:COSAG01_NODE_16328_length_1245_cov_60.267888_2_plen_100_part_01